ncbi:MAG TPA: NDMA-dependent alcohol dehydrogenase [Acidimicrobiales bacterium]|jgi:NDMA-dependent alcohol dehydrogenase|nr:NDMA-dependent alcohol dehydrogenase [Acidimicrobiales bacterium]
MRTRASIVSGVKEPWRTEEIELDEPHAHEVRVKMAYAGMCQSDEHLRNGTFSQPPEVLAMLSKTGSMYPSIGGHEGAGIVDAVGDEVHRFAPGDYVAASFIPSCGQCDWCATGRGYLCELGMTTLLGPMISDGTFRHHLGGEDLNRMCQLGTFSEYMVVNEGSLVKVDQGVNLRAAALISCGLSTGFGAAADRAQVRPGEAVIVVGCGGVGSGAIQGAKFAGASVIIACDLLPSKVERALKIGATHGAANLTEAAFVAAELTRGRMADVVILTPAELTGDLIMPACKAGAKAARIVTVAVAPYSQTEVTMDLFGFTMYNQTLMGTVFGSQSPRIQIPRLLDLYNKGTFLVDELVTKEYTLDQVQQGYDDLEAGKNVRGVVKFG